ncbi:rhodanese-like domain-containing protein [Alkalibacterium olivapovliticus]|uniref:Rhodanese-related sulfurtransferase n=1 Tax=Alkalibacterium olivapovliticus TaxID=99907 RepID=A0A2T0W9Z5_9LACT|nr:rhodanese-like domain-containing protein [Alkalibacterium olivapovliticus]PRY83539.1 rhodanese-related sulfurtransferase [Alkalibacterium olivapovliticus]
MREMTNDILVDAKGLACPMPIVRTKKALKDAASGSIVEVQATDKGSTADLKAWASKAGHDYLGTVDNEGTLKHYLRAGGEEEETVPYPNIINNDELQHLINSNESITILDVRETEEYDAYHIPEAVSIPLGELEEKMEELSDGKPIYVVCRTGNRSDMAAHLLSENGYGEVVNVKPGMSEWKEEEANVSLTAMTPKELAKKVIQKEDLFILDVRNEDAFEDWKVDGKGFDYLNIPYFDLLDGVEEILPQLPADKQLLVVCAKENSSIMVGELLAEEGVSSFYLSGGMKAWSEYLEPVKVADLNEGGELFQFVRLGKGCLSYMVVSGNEAVIIDSSRTTAPYLKLAEDKGVSISHVLDTHLHADHISGGRTIAQETGASYWLPTKDAEEATFDFEPLEEGAHIQVGATNIDVKALYTPGHTIGSMSFIIDDSYLLSGDILFVDSIGRPDLAGKADDWVSDLRSSLYVTYQNLSEDLIVLPAHFMIIDEVNDDGSVAEKLGVLFEKNHGLNIEDEDKFRSAVTDNLPPQPNAYQDIRQTNMGKIAPDEEEQREMEIGPNRCAVR